MIDNIKSKIDHIKKNV